MKINLQCLLLLLFVVVTANVYAQVEGDTLSNQIDTTRLTRFNTDSVKKYFKASDTLIASQLNKVEKYTIDFNNINNKLRRGFDTSYIHKGLPESDSIISIAKTNLSAFGRLTSLKILNSTKTILLQQQRLLSKWQADLSAYNSVLNDIKGQMSLIKRDSSLLIMPSDSLLFIEYIKKLTPLGEKIELADSNSTNQLRRLGVLQNLVSTNYLAVTDLLNEVNYQINNYTDRLLANEFDYIWNSKLTDFQSEKFEYVVQKSLQESALLVQLYSNSNWLSRILLLVIALIFYFWMRNNIRFIRKNKVDSDAVLAKAKHIPKHLFNATIVFSLMLIPFVYPEAPQAFTQSLWALQIIALGMLLRNKLRKVSGLQLLVLLVLFNIMGFTNLLIETTSIERWIQFVISAISILLGVWILVVNKRNYFTRNTLIRWVTFLFIVINTLGFLLNIFGRVTLAKLLNTGASYGLIEAINLLVFVEIIIDAIFLIKEAGKKDSRFSAYFEYKGLEKSLKNVLTFFAIIIWLVVFTQSLNVYDTVFGSIYELLTKQLQVGDVTFTLSHILIFGLILWASTILSQMVSFIFGNQQDGSILRNVNNKLGSTILLIRLGILSVGVLLAFAASGIPIDKLAIIIGALGVGIGFGLQNIVNNLVSGIVLAFEKPIQIGDIIEVGDRSGIVKEIGIRSSKLNTYDGSEVIIPNGDLLSQHLINWTRNNENRRIFLPVGVAYGSNMKTVKEVILQILHDHKEVFSFPEPFILVQRFGDSSLDLSVYFWAEINNWYILQSDILGLIYEALNTEGISIPFPQRDLHIKSIDESLINKINKL